MGRRNTSFYDDLFLQKTKAIFCKVIDNLNANKEIDHVEALTSRETMARWDDNSQSGSTAGSSKTRWPVTFEQFVEHLDGQDEFVQDAAELLVSVSAAEERALVD
jgi:predicted xylose isomerase-like sugar epimerase